MNQIQNQYFDIPPITRFYTTACVITTLLVQLEIISPFQIYFNPHLIFHQYQIWRLFSCFCFFGNIGFNFLFNILFIYRYCRYLEENHFHDKCADFVVMFLFGAVFILAAAVYINMVFPGHALTLMLIYVWSRRSMFVRMSFFGILNFRAPYLPWVLLGFTFLLGNSILVDVLGMSVGHLYYFLEDVFPHQPNGFRILRTPNFIKRIFNRNQYADMPEVDVSMAAAAAESGAANQNRAANQNAGVAGPGGFDWGGEDLNDDDASVNNSVKPASATTSSSASSSSSATGVDAASNNAIGTESGISGSAAASNASPSHVMRPNGVSSTAAASSPSSNS